MAPGFRNPDEYFPKGTPNALISESDFADCNVLSLIT